MLIDIDKIKVGDRIRKDFGDIEELAEDISANGLINPPVVNKEYELLAGERRLRACKLLGWPQIEVRMMDTRDAEHDFEIEVSENENRKDFSRTEREEVYTRYVQMRLQQSGPIGPRVHTAEAEAAKLLGTSRTNMNREREILANRDLLDPADFADWDEGRLSTNKAYQRIKAAQKQAEQQRILAERERDTAKRDLAEAYRASELLETQVAALKRQVAEKPKPEVVEREVVREIVPDDYNEIKRRVKELEHLESVHHSDNRRLRESLNATRIELDKAKDVLKINENIGEVRRDVQYLTTATVGYLRQYAGLTWTANQLSEIDEDTRKQLTKAVQNLATFSSTLLGILENMND